MINWGFCCRDNYKIFLQYYQNLNIVFISDLKSSQEIKWVVDVTIAYPGGNPLDLHGIGFGYWPPCVIHTHYRIYPVSEIPLETEKLSNWLYERFIEKEHLLQQYYTEDKFLDETDTQKRVLPQMPRKQLQQSITKLTLVLIFYSVSTYIFLFYLFVPMFNIIFSIFSWFFYSFSHVKPIWIVLVMHNVLKCISSLQWILFYLWRFMFIF